VPRFANREEYEAWKRGETAAPAAPVPAGTTNVVETLPVEATPRSAAGPAAPAAKPKAGLKETLSGLPPWAWIFVIGCFALPVVNLGGAIPGALGFGGAAACANVAKKPDWEAAPRALVCALITGAVWLAWAAAAVAIVGLRK